MNYLGLGLALLSVLQEILSSDVPCLPITPTGGILLIIIPGLGVAIYGNFEQRRLEKNRVCEGALAISALAASNQEDGVILRAGGHNS